MTTENRELRALLARVKRATGRVPKGLKATFGPLLAYRDDPAGFVRDVLGVEPATRRSDGGAYQVEPLEALLGASGVLVVSGHGTGKTRQDAMAVLWFLLTRPFSRCLVVAPEFSRQVAGILFAEIAKVVRQARVKLPVEVFESRVVVGGFSDWCATGMSAGGDAGRLEGFHAEAGVLLLVDESKGVPAETFDALRGALSGTGFNRLLVTSTPGGQSGPFYSLCTNVPAGWKLFEWDSTDSSLVRPEWVAECADAWGVDSPLYLSRVRGKFCGEIDGQLIPVALVEAAVDRWRELTAREKAGVPRVSGEVVIGLDTARSIRGDENLAIVMEGGVLRHVEAWRTDDTQKSADRVAMLIVTHKPRRVRIDVGGPGAGIADRLLRIGLSTAIEQVQFGGQAKDPSRFANTRSELYFELKERLVRGELALPPDDKLLGDLCAVCVEMNAAGRILLEPKAAVQKRLGRSPDRGDALVMALTAPGPTRGVSKQFNTATGQEIRVQPGHSGCTAYSVINGSCMCGHAERQRRAAFPHRQVLTESGPLWLGSQRPPAFDTKGNPIPARPPGDPGGARAVWREWGPRQFAPAPGLVELPEKPGFWMEPSEYEQRFGHKHFSRTA